MHTHNVWCGNLNFTRQFSKNYLLIIIFKVTSFTLHIKQTKKNSFILRKFQFIFRVFQCVYTMHFVSIFMHTLFLLLLFLFFLMIFIRFKVNEIFLRFFALFLDENNLQKKVSNSRTKRRTFNVRNFHMLVDHVKRS